MDPRAPDRLGELSRLLDGLTAPRLHTLSSHNLFEIDPPPEIEALGLPLIRFHVNDLEPASHPATVTTIVEGQRTGTRSTSVRWRRAENPELLTVFDLTDELGVVVLAFSDDAEDEPPGPEPTTRLSQILVFDAAGAIVDDAALTSLLGHAPGRHVNEGMLPLIHPDDVEGAVEAFISMVANVGVSHHQRMRMQAADGTWRWVKLHSTAHHVGELVQVRSTVTDVDAEVRAVEAVARSEHHLRTLTDAMPVGVFRADSEGTLSFVNRRLAELLPVEIETEVDHWTALVHHTDQSRLDVAMWKLCRAFDAAERAAASAADPAEEPADGPLLDDEFRLPEAPEHRADPANPSRTRLWNAPVRSIRVIARPVRTEDGGIEVIGSVEETTERRRLAEELRHAATHDALTGLANRAGLDDHLDRRLAFRDGRELTLLFVDLDGFKRINDSLGHRAGDRLLRTLAARVQSVMRDEDFVGRFGGDEFVVVSDQPGGVTGATALAERVMAALREPVQIGGVVVRPQASIGVSLSSTSGEHGPRSREAMLSDADSAMYAAKAAGRGRVRVADGSIRSTAHLRWAIESSLAGVEHVDELGLWLAYQPIVDHVSGDVLGIESLLRWEHPEHGPVSPLELIAIAEETGAIHRITDWALEQLATDVPIVRSWDPSFADISLGVNLSNIQLSRPAYVQHHLDVVASHRLDPSDLVIEVTETALIEVAEQGEQAIRELHDAGVNIALDDFGAGYSSIEYLTRLPVDYLKLDRALVNRMVERPDARRVISGLAGICRDLGIAVIAEGVETEVERDLCLEAGVTELQGYLLCRPLPLDDLRTWMTGRLGHSGPSPVGAAGRPAGDAPQTGRR